MFEGGGNYRARLAARNYKSRSDQAFSTPPPNTFNKAKTNRELAFSSPPSPRDLQRSQILASFGQPQPLVEGLVGGSSQYLGRLSTPILQRAIQTASMEGKRIGGSIVEEAASQGVRYGQSGVARAGRAAEDELFEFINDLERIGVKPQTANRLLRGFAQYADDPVEAMAGLGEDVSRSTKGAKEALIERLLTRLGIRAEKEFF